MYSFCFIKLDEYGSFVWQQIDGKKSIYEIGKELGNKQRVLQISYMKDFQNILEY